MLAEEAEVITEPWWGTPAFTLGGLLLGAVLTPWVAYLIGSRTKKQDAAEKSKAEAAAAVLEFLTESESFVTTLWQTDQAIVDPINLASTKMTILCSPAIVEAGVRVQIALEEFQRDHAKLDTSAGEAEFRALVRPFYRTFYVLVNVTRSEFGGTVLPGSAIDLATSTTHVLEATTPQREIGSS